MNYNVKIIVFQTHTPVFFKINLDFETSKCRSLNKGKGGSIILHFKYIFQKIGSTKNNRPPTSQG